MERAPAYKFGAPVEPPFFCDREEELAAVEARIRAGIHVFLLSPRRYGKTSLLQRTRDKLRREGLSIGYANLLFATSEAEVAAAVLAAVVDALTSRRARVRYELAEILRRLRLAPNVSIGTDGRVSLGFDPTLARRSWQVILDDARNLLAGAAAERGAALLLDEFQVVATTGRRGMGGAFKAFADALTNCSVVFSGSHLSLMEQLTAKRGAPLYGMGERIVLDVIPEAKFTPYLQRRARAVDRALPVATAREIYERAGAVPHYVQYLALAALEATPPGGTITTESVEEGVAAVVRRQASDFADRFELLSAAQQRILKVLARNPASKVYAREFLEAVDVANTNAVTQALRVLQERELVQRRTGVFRVVDPFLAHWLT